MKNIKMSFLYFFTVTLFSPVDLIAIKPAGVALMEKVEGIADKNMPLIVKASENLCLEGMAKVAESIRESNETAKILLPIIAKASPKLGSAFGERFGYETVNLIFDKLGKCATYSLETLEICAVYGKECGGKSYV